MLGKCPKSTYYINIHLLWLVSDVENLPSLNSLQLGLLNDEPHRETLMDTLCQLLHVAIRDPGVPLLPEVTQELRVVN